jgi:tetratricopeptide (TPR) repeat protein
MFALSFYDVHNDVHVYIAFDKEVEAFNDQTQSYPLYIGSTLPNVDETMMKRHFAYIDSLSQAVAETKDNQTVKPLLMLRAVAYTTIQNFDSAIDDLSTLLQIDSTMTLAYWQRAVCQTRINEFNASQGTNIDLKSANVLSDLCEAIKLAPHNAFLYYNRANLYAQRKDYQHAVDDYTHALELDGNMAEAWYNRGLVYLEEKKIAEGISDLSKAGELGLYDAYSIIKKYREK